MRLNQIALWMLAIVASTMSISPSGQAELVSSEIASGTFDPVPGVDLPPPPGARVYTDWKGETYWVATPEPPVGNDVDRAPIPRELLRPTLVLDHFPGTPPAFSDVGLDAFQNQKNGVVAEAASDTQFVTGVWSTISITQATNLGNGHYSSWPGLYLANGDFIQTGYETVRHPINGDQIQVFAQIWKVGWTSANTCNDGSGLVTCHAWVGLVSVGNRDAFYFKNGVNGNANRWGFFLNSDANKLADVVLASINSGSNTALGFNERDGDPATATLTSNYWDCGLCQLKSGVWSTPSHVRYWKEGTPPCPPMGFTLLWTNEFEMGSAEGCGTAHNARIW